MGAPRYKLYCNERGYIGCVKTPKTAAWFVANWDGPMSIRIGHRVSDTIVDFDENDMPLSDIIERLQDAD